jgi:hypothetical protein
VNQPVAIIAELAIQLLGCVKAITEGGDIIGLGQKSSVAGKCFSSFALLRVRACSSAARLAGLIGFFSAAASMALRAR